MGFSNDVLTALSQEFSFPSSGALAVTVARLLLAAVLGGVIGLDREKKERSAGLKTHILVAVGSALFVLAPLYGGVTPGENTRVIQGVVSGIGFLGAGAILKLQKDGRVEGLTTAAGIWLTSAIGVAVGLGHGMVALVATVVALFVVSVLPHLMRPKPHADEPLA
ncbi:MAG: MgtC/SapB family protein [Lysobacter sp.]|nr:MAG: MgtC/SapB family protein [Lysobacter sp.]